MSKSSGHSSLINFKQMQTLSQTKYSKFNHPLRGDFPEHPALPSTPLLSTSEKS